MNFELKLLPEADFGIFTSRFSLVLRAAGPHRNCSDLSRVPSVDLLDGLCAVSAWEPIKLTGLAFRILGFKHRNPLVKSFLIELACLTHLSQGFLISEVIDLA